MFSVEMILISMIAKEISYSFFFLMYLVCERLADFIYIIL